MVKSALRVAEMGSRRRQSTENGAKCMLAVIEAGREVFLIGSTATDQELELESYRSGRADDVFEV